jgi:DNA-directed RNA polymerase subunit RPC12/RpoP
MTEPTSYRPSSLQEFAELFSLTLFVSVAIVIIMHLVGVKTEGIGLGSAPLYAQMLSLLHASVYEEIVTRLVFLGLPVYLLRRFFPRDGAGRVSPLTILGGVHEIGKIEIVFIIISATIFGVAHTPAWGWWKLLPAFFAGLVMGYLYIKYGIHYSIMFHFATDYMYVSMSMNSLVNVSMGLVYLALIAMGVVFAISYTVRVMQRFHILKKKPKKKNETVEEFEPWIDVRCPTCGSQEFSYLEDGKLKCLRCGTIFEREYQEQPTQSEQEYPENTPPP